MVVLLIDCNTEQKETGVNENKICITKSKWEVFIVEQNNCIGRLFQQQKMTVRDVLTMADWVLLHCFFVDLFVCFFAIPNHVDFVATRNQIAVFAQFVIQPL